MGIEQYPLNLSILANSEMTKYLAVGSREILLERSKLFDLEINNRRKKSPIGWRFSILPERPLVFNICKVNGLELQIDVFCELEGLGNDINKHSMVLRVWSIDKNVSYREDIDAVALEGVLGSCGWKRVMLRFHFDLRNQRVKHPEPRHHLQVGGAVESDEYCWLHPKIDVPRFQFPPMDLILVCEFILVNFFHERSSDFRKKPEWSSLVRKSQELFVNNYYTDCRSYLLDNNSTLLENWIKNN